MGEYLACRKCGRRVTYRTETVHVLDSDVPVEAGCPRTAGDTREVDCHQLRTGLWCDQCHEFVVEGGEDEVEEALAAADAVMVAPLPAGPPAQQ